MDGFDILAMGIGLFDPNNPLVQINQKLHSSALYNGLQISVNALAIFTGAATTTMKCFVAGTMILTAAGLVAIENIKAGNKVISTNPETFEVAEKTVLETYVRETTELVHLTINGELIKTTYDHPFHVKDVGFISAGELYIGDKLLDSNGNTLLLEDRKVENLDEPVKVYNFQVEDFHTYHVGENAGLVHNATYPSHMNADGSLKPNCEYTTGENGYTYKTNSDGYIESAHADTLKFKTHKGRLSHSANTPDKKVGDHAGHLFADQFGGSPKLDNIVSQDGYLNTHQYREIERAWAKALKNGQKVTDVDIKLSYSGNSGRPTSFIVSYKIDGVQVHKNFYQ